MYREGLGLLVGHPMEYCKSDFLINNQHPMIYCTDVLRITLLLT